MMGRLALAVSAALLAALSASGCVWSPCGKSHGTSYDWTEPGLFAAFPPDGKRGGYSVESWHENGFVPPRKGVGDETFTPPPDFDAGNVTRRLALSNDIQLDVDPQDNATWRLWAYGEHGDGWTTGVLRSTFERLGLPPPSVEDPHFTWFTDGLC